MAHRNEADTTASQEISYKKIINKIKYLHNFFIWLSPASRRTSAVGIVIALANTFGALQFTKGK